MTSAWELLTGEKEEDPRRRAIEDMNRLFAAKLWIKDSEKVVKDFDPSASDYGSMGALRRYLMDNPGEKLVDHETGIMAELASGGRRLLFDAPAAIMEKAPELWQKLVRLGCVSIDGPEVRKAMQEQKLLRSEMSNWMHEGEGTPRLVIKKVAE